MNYTRLSAHITKLLLIHADFIFLYYLVGYSVVFGFSTAVDTLSAQSFGTGALNLVGLVAQRVAVIQAILCLPIWIVWWNVSDILITLKLDLEIAHFAGEYTWILAFSLPAASWFQTLKKYLIAQKVVTPLIIVLIGTNCVNIVLAYLFIHPFGFEFLGGPMATVVSQWFMLASTAFLCRSRHDHTLTWPDVSSNVFREWLPIIRLGAPGAASLALEWCYAQFICLIAGFMGTVELGALVVLLQIQAVSSTIPYGIGISASAITAFEVGGGRYQTAKRVGITSTILAAGVQVIVLVIFLASTRQISSLFSKDVQVIELVSEVAPITALMLLFDGMQYSASGILRGVGLQRIGALAILLGYYFTGLPIALFLTFYLDYDLAGLIGSWLVAVAVTSLVSFMAIAPLNWNKISRVTSTNNELNRLQSPTDDFL